MKAPGVNPGPVLLHVPCTNRAARPPIEPRLAGLPGITAEIRFLAAMLPKTP